MNDLPRIRRIGWILVAAAAVGLLVTLLISLAGPGGLGFLVWTLLLILVPAALVGAALLAYHWFIVSKRTGRRL
ncbi:MAG: hypothetical protein ACTHV8_06740 [Nesterenkonia sp.]|uniref:hypothetical protein n=1 Tax=Garicola koreensis TaxID=1262554 RepID=UPI0031EBA935